MKRQLAWARETFLKSKEAEQGSGSWHHCRACSRTLSLGCSGRSKGQGGSGYQPEYPSTAWSPQLIHSSIPPSSHRHLC